METCLNKKIFSKPVQIAALFLAGLLLTPAVYASAEIKEFVAHYTLKKNDMNVANVKRQLKINGNQLEYISEANVTGLISLFRDDRIVERSIMKQNKQGKLEAISYSFAQTGSSKQRKYLLEFDWPNKKLSNSYMDKELSLPDMTYDLLGFQIVLSQQLAKKLPVIEFHVAEKKRIRHYQFIPSGTESLSLKVKDSPINTIKLTYVDKIKNRQLDIWCDPAQNYLPVKIKRTEKDGDTTLMEYYQPGVDAFEVNDTPSW